MRNCPVDDFSLKQEVYEGVTIDVCPHCNGVWLDDGELQQIQDAQALDFRDVPTSRGDSVRAAETMARARDEAARNCVVCETAMEQKEYAFSSQVMIDQCPKGHGIWLDRNELSHLEMFYEDQETLDKIFAAMEDEGKGFGGFLAKLWGRVRG